MKEKLMKEKLMKDIINKIEVCLSFYHDCIIFVS